MFTKVFGKGNGSESPHKSDKKKKRGKKGSTPARNKRNVCSSTAAAPVTGGGALSKEEFPNKHKNFESVYPETDAETEVEQIDTELLRERQKERMLADQKKRQENAADRGGFVKNQIVKYYHRGTETWYDDVVVVGVHYDDGPDKPYYTIKYKCMDVEIDEEGNEAVVQSEIEKQTTPDRLERIEWNKEATWGLINPSGML